MLPEQDLDKLWTQYREACPEVELGPNFMPAVWQRIEARRAFWPVFEHLAKVAVTVCAFACLIFALLDFTSVRRPMITEQSYAEALAVDQNSEATFYAEALHPPAGNPVEGRR